MNYESEGMVRYGQEDEYNGDEGLKQPSTLQKAQERERIPAGNNVSTNVLLQIVPLLETERTLANGKKLVNILEKIKNKVRRVQLRMMT